LILYTDKDNLSYVSNSQGQILENAQFTLYARWLYLDNEQYRAITHNNVDNLPKGTTVRWYRYSP
jgi:hypothetical protein